MMLWFTHTIAFHLCHPFVPAYSKTSDVLVTSVFTSNTISFAVTRVSFATVTFFSLPLLKVLFICTSIFNLLTNLSNWTCNTGTFPKHSGFPGESICIEKGVLWSTQLRAIKGTGMRLASYLHSQRVGSSLLRVLPVGHWQSSWDFEARLKS